MKIKRNGQEFELTEQEFFAANEEFERLRHKEDIEGRLEGYDLEGLSEEKKKEIFDSARKAFEKALSFDEERQERYYEILDDVIKDEILKATKDGERKTVTVTLSRYVLVRRNIDLTDEEIKETLSCKGNLYQEMAKELDETDVEDRLAIYDMAGNLIK